MPISSLVAKKIVFFGKRLYARGLIAGGDGNISARIDSDRIMITPSGVCKGFLSPDDLVIINGQGRHVSGRNKASSESAMHLHIYQKRSDVTVCVHAHPPYATAFAVAGIPLAEKVLPEVVVFVGDIPLADYAPPGTELVARSLDKYIADHNAFLLKNHGLVTVGQTFEEAYNRLETVEHFARILFLARQLGNVDHLDGEEIARLDKIRQDILHNTSKIGQGW